MDLRYSDVFNDLHFIAIIMKTKEEILTAQNTTWYDNDGDAVVPYDSALVAMESYATQKVAERENEIIEKLVDKFYWIDSNWFKQFLSINKSKNTTE